MTDRDRYASFEEAVARTGAVAAAGGRTAWDVGGPLDGDVRLVPAPRGIVDHQPSEMTVRVGAGTTVAELDRFLAASGQCVALPAKPGSTVGGVLAIGRSGLRRLGWGPVRDAVLEIRYASDSGQLVTAGGPMIKNVTGFDLCRLMVGSLGTLGLFAETVLRTRPLPETEVWVRGTIDPRSALDTFPSAAAILWDGATTWALLSGLEVDVAEQRDASARLGLVAADGPPALPTGARWSLAPSELYRIPRRHPDVRFVAEVGVGVVHADRPLPPAAADPRVVALHRRIKAEFDPEGRLSPGRDPLCP